jgi:hypothetical protein
MENSTHSSTSVAEILAEKARAVGVTSSALDDIVTDAAINYRKEDINMLANEHEREAMMDLAEQEASDINNEGFLGQITFLLSQQVPLDEIEKALGF